MSLRIEAARRRTFAIISHPDAGKTTLTEKLLLLSGAIHIAGSVKARKAKRHATSDWMQIEKERGISVASSVMQMEYRDCVLNLLDTPGHQDFSEDTYRVLTAVDAALMVIDAANGVEPQTRRLLEVCRARRIPIITFINKLDREVRDPLSLIDEIEQALEMTACPFTWPVGMGRSFAGIYDLRRDLMRVFPLGRAGAGEDSNDADRKGASAADGDGGELAAAQCAERFGQTFLQADEEMNLIRHAGTTFDHAAFLAGRQTPVFFGSAVNNFGIPEVLDAVVDLAPAPTPRHAMQRVVQPQEEKFSAVVFKIQANMDPAHRDRIAFARICSGRFERGMQIKVVRTGKTVRPSTVVSFLSQRRDVLDAAFPGDIIGIPNRGTLQLGDSLTEGEDLQFTGLPFFAPEMFQGVDLADPMRAKQLNVGLRQLGEEGAIQVSRRGGRTAVRGGAAPARARVQRQGPAVTGAHQPRALDHCGRCDQAGAVHRQQRAPHRLRRRRCAYLRVRAPGRAGRDAGALARHRVSQDARARWSRVPHRHGVRHGRLHQRRHLGLSGQGSLPFGCLGQ
jgi:peptide chain release factor 3